MNVFKSPASVQVDLTSVAPEVTHELWRSIENGEVKSSFISANLHQVDFFKNSLQGHLHFLLTVTATGGTSSSRKELKEDIVAQYVSHFYQILIC